MSKRVYISADYDKMSGDRKVVDILNAWGSDLLHKTEFVDTAKVASGSVSDGPDCRPCDLKKEFNRQINASSAVIFVVGDRTALRTAGNKCERAYWSQYACQCTPYKQNAYGMKLCKVSSVYAHTPSEDMSCINNYSYLRHEFEQAKFKGKRIIVVYNSLYKQPSWLPPYMKAYESQAKPFWTRNNNYDIVGNYYMIKEALGYA